MNRFIIFLFSIFAFSTFAETPSGCLKVKESTDLCFYNNYDLYIINPTKTDYDPTLNSEEKEICDRPDIFIPDLSDERECRIIPAFNRIREKNNQRLYYASILGQSLGGTYILREKVLVAPGSVSVKVGVYAKSIPRHGKFDLLFYLKNSRGEIIGDIDFTRQKLAEKVGTTFTVTFAPDTGPILSEEELTIEIRYDVDMRGISNGATFKIHLTEIELSRYHGSL